VVVFDQSVLSLILAQKPLIQTALIVQAIMLATADTSVSGQLAILRQTAAKLSLGYA